jgi:hypothetical protein
VEVRKRSNILKEAIELKPRISPKESAHVANAAGAGFLPDRRVFLRVGGLGLFGLGLTDIAPAAASSISRPAPARACIFIFYQGGPSHLDTWDMKPSAPLEVRGEFQAVQTSVPGIRACEHLPALARVAHKLAIVRSLHHGMTNHLPGAFATLCGRIPLRGDQLFVGQDRDDPPSIGSAFSFLRPSSTPGMPSFVAVPYRMWNERDVPGQSSGFLGSAHEPFQMEADPNAADFRISELEPSDGVTRDRLERREYLLSGTERVSTRKNVSDSAAELGAYHHKALEMLRSGPVRSAFRLAAEEPRLRDRYGRTTHGQSLLLARRLVEAGVRFVAVYDRKINGPESWDTHGENFRLLKDVLLPAADQGLAALIADLEGRGLLDSTLIVAVGEFGRTPKVNSAAGRDHWPFCYTGILAGAGVAGGALHGSSDRLGAYPDSHPTTPDDLAATIYWRMGVDARTELADRSGRRYRLADGMPLRSLFNAGVS